LGRDDSGDVQFSYLRSHPALSDCFGFEGAAKASELANRMEERAGHLSLIL
jgi:hypothetical protein